MKNTKSEIVRNAVLLFNKKGFFKVTVKEIADEMGISPGNLTYHFKKKEHLLEAVQGEILKGSQDIMTPENTEITLSHFEQMFSHFYGIQRQYCFYFSEIIYLLEAYPAITGRYKEAIEHRFRSARQLVDYYVSTGRMVPEDGEVNYDFLIHNMWMISTFWTLGGALADRKKMGSEFETPIPSLWEILTPYLSEKGKVEYLKIKSEDLV